ncbi:MAG: DUF2339 domain-containing protein [Acidobacteria bacterium]|nr:DUF2339 domain-containing protein [Acidobacteriota bacterium]
MEALLLVVLVVALYIYISKTNKLASKVDELERGIHDQANAVWKTTAQLELELRKLRGLPVEQPKPRVPPTPAPPLPSAAEPPTPPPSVLHPIPTPPSLAAPPLRPSRTRAEWEALIGGKLLNRIGALALIIGVGFFLKYAFDNDWFPEWMRVLIGFVAGMALLSGGARFHKQGFQIFAQGLVGAGISILYLSVYASFNFYHLVPQPVAFVLMSAVTVVTFLQAFKYDSLAVSLLGWAGGFLTPFLLRADQPNEVGLFTYIGLLDLGLLAALLKKDPWVILEPLTLVATYVTYELWDQRYYTVDKLSVTVLFLTLFWGVFYALDVLRALRRTTTFATLRQFVGAFNALFYVAAMYDIIDPQYPRWTGAVLLVIGAAYLATALAIKRRRPEDVAVIPRHILTAIVLLVIATSIQFSDFATVAWWSVEAFVLVWSGIHWKQRYVWQAALGLFALAILELLTAEGALSYAPIESFRLILNWRALAFAALAAALGTSTALFKRLDEKQSAAIQIALHYGWCALVFILCTVETNDAFSRLKINTTGALRASLAYAGSMTLAAIWTIYSLVLSWVGLRKNMLPILYCGLASLFLAIGSGALQGSAFIPIERFSPLINIRAGVLAFIVVGLLIHALWLKESLKAYDWIGNLLSAIRLAVVLLVFELVSVETRDYFERAIALTNQIAASTDVSEKLTRLRNLKQLALSGVWLVYCTGLMVVGIWRRTVGLRAVAIVLFGITIVKIFFYDLSFLETLYRIFSFIGLGLILLAVSYLYRRYKAVIFGEALGAED